MTASEKLMRKKKVYKAELDKATPLSGELWERATGRLDEIRTRYNPPSSGNGQHLENRLTSSHVGSNPTPCGK